MKSFLYILLFYVSIVTAFAQQDTLSPKWEKGLTWKISSTTLSPNKALAKENIVAYDTTFSNFLWEIVDVKDSIVTLSILPLSIRMTNAAQDSLDDSVIKDAFEKSKNSNTPIIYQAELNGKLNKIPSETDDSLSIYDIPKERYIINDSALLQLYAEEISTENVEEDYDENGDLYEYEEDYNVQYEFMVQFFDKVIETIHSPYGEEYKLDSIVDIKEFTKEKWDSYQKGLAEMAKMMDVSGFYQIKKENNQLVYHMEMDMNLGNMMKELFSTFDGDEKKKRKEKKKTNDILGSLKMNMVIKADYKLDENNHFPMHYNTEVQSNVSSKDENASFSAFNELIFE